jgi:hypothetical protein
MVPEGHLRSPQKMYQDLMSWLERLSTGQVASVESPVINLIGNTTNRGGLVVRVRLDRRRYPTARRSQRRNCEN